MRDLIGRFRHRAKQRTLTAIANAAVAKIWDQAADELEQYLRDGGAPAPIGDPAIPIDAKKPGRAAPPKKQTKADRAAAQRQMIQEPAYDVIREAGQPIEGADVVAALQAQGMDIDLRRLLPVLHAGVRDGELTRDKTRYRRAQIFK